MFFSEQFTLESDSPRKSMLKQGQSAARKRPFNVVNSFLTEGQKDDLDDGNILSSLGMNKEQDIFKSPQSDAFFKKFSEPEPIEKPTKTPSKKTVVGQSQYFCSSTPTKQDEEVNPKADLSDIDKEISEDMAKQKSQVPPKATKIPKEKTPSTKEQKLEVSAIKPRQARPIGEFSVSSLEKELQEIMQYLKEEREKDQELFVECSKSLRQKTESIIEGLESMIKHRYESLDETLQSVMCEFEKEWETSKGLEDEFNSLRAQLSSIMNVMLKDPCLE